MGNDQDSGGALRPAAALERAEELYQRYLELRKIVSPPHPPAGDVTEAQTWTTNQLDLSSMSGPWKPS